VYSGKVTRKLASAPMSATQRTMRACSSRPKASSNTPNAIGIQIARLNKPISSSPYRLSHSTSMGQVTKYDMSTRTPTIIASA